MDGGAWWAAVHGVAKSRTRLSDFTFTFHFHELEKEMASHSSVLAWRIPWTEEPGGLESMGSQRVRHDGRDSTQAGTSYQVQKVRQCLSDSGSAVYLPTLLSSGFHVSVTHFCFALLDSGCF